MTRFDGRLRGLEARPSSGQKTGHGCGEVWIELADGRMRDKDGEILSREEFELQGHAGIIPILPDNGRDEPLPAIMAKSDRR